MKREVPVNSFDMMLNRMISSVSLFVLVLSMLVFACLFFYRDFSDMLADFKKNTTPVSPVFESPDVSLLHSPISTNKTSDTNASGNNSLSIEQRDAEKIFVAYELGDIALASRLITDFLVNYPQSVSKNSVLLAGAKIMYDKGDSNGALDYIQRILKDTLVSNQDYTESVLLMGEIARRKKQYDTYIQLFLEQAYFKAEDTVKSKLALYLGYLFLNKGDHRSSLSYFNNVTGEDGVLGRADLYKAQSMRPETINALENFITQYPNSPNYEYAKQQYLQQSFLHAETLMVRGYFDSAERVYKKTIDLFALTEHGDFARLKLAGIYYDKQRCNESIKSLGEIISNEDKTHNPDALFMLGKIHFEQGMEEQSLGFFRSLLEQYPDSKLVPKAKEWYELLKNSLQST